MQPQSRRTRFRALLACIPAWLLLSTTASIHRAARRWALELPWTPSLSLLKDLRWFPVSVGALVVGLVICIAACRNRSHVLAAGGALLSTAIVYCDMLAFWAIRPEFIDMRIPVTFVLAYVVQMAAAIASIAHVIIFFAEVRGNSA